MDAGVVLRPLQDPQWSSFVAGHCSALPFHHPSWAAMLAECYRFRAFCLTVQDRDGQIVAGLPVVEVRHGPGRRRWVSLPFTDYCPPLLAEVADAGVTRRLGETRRAYGVRCFEVRTALPAQDAHQNGTFLSHQLVLGAAEDALLASFHPNQVRRNIRRAERAGVTIRVGDAEPDVTEVFYSLHTRTRRRLGVPVQPLRYFRLLWRRVLQPGLGTVLVAELDGVPVASGIFLASGATCVYKYGASDERRWDARPNHLLFWEAIRWATAKGCRTFDFGRTHLADEGLRQFKARWGTVERELAYSVFADTPPRVSGGGTPALLCSVIRHGPTVVPRVLGEVLYRYTA
jgi:CelD/BcsL family acetyltransferase involved in cellulose biosynthesis